MLKAGLVDKKKVKKVDHEKRVKHKDISAAEREQHEKEKKEAWLKKQAAIKEEQRKLAEMKKEMESSKDFHNMVRNIIQQNAVKQVKGGNKKFYFVTPLKKIEAFRLADDIIRKLESGKLAIAWDESNPRDPFVLIPQTVAQKVADMKPENLLFFFPKHGIC